MDQIEQHYPSQDRLRVEDRLIDEGPPCEEDAKKYEIASKVTGLSVFDLSKIFQRIHESYKIVGSWRL